MTPEVRVKNLSIVLKKIKEEEGLNSYAKIGEAYNVNASFISQLLNGTRNFGEKAARNLEKKLRLAEFSLDTIRQSETTTNNGISVGGNNTNTGVQIGQALQSNISSNFKSVDDWDSETPLEADELEIPFYKDFKVACGHGADGTAYENEKRRLRISRATLERIGSHKDMVFATLADGDSMSPTINDGATIWVDTSKDIKDGKIFVFEYGGLFMCKRLYRLPNNGLKIVSDNETDYPTFEITGQEREENGFRLIGWVWHWSVMERW